MKELSNESHGTGTVSDNAFGNINMGILGEGRPL